MLKQRPTGRSLGNFKLLAGNISWYASMFTLCFTSLTGYEAINRLLSTSGIYVPIWVFYLGLAVIVAGLFVTEWVIIMPSLYGAGNIQSWQADNPMKDHVLSLENKMDELIKIVEDLRSRERL